jgi:hypothetical protein
MKRLTVTLTGILLLAVAVLPAGTASAKQYPIKFDGNNVTYKYTDSGGTQYITEIGGLPEYARRCRKNRAVSITFTPPEGVSGNYGSDTTDSEGVFIVQHSALDAPTGTVFKVTIAPRKVRHGTCLGTEATLIS